MLRHHDPVWLNEILSPHFATVVAAEFSALTMNGRQPGSFTRSARSSA